jgi:hypothetical protein
VSRLREARPKGCLDTGIQLCLAMVCLRAKPDSACGTNDLSAISCEAITSVLLQPSLVTQYREAILPIEFRPCSSQDCAADLLLVH